MNAPDTFTWVGKPGRVVFGSGTLSRAAEEAAALGIRRALIVSTAPRVSAARNLARQLGDLSAGVFAGAVMHTPVEVTETALRELAACRADGIVAIGGGSTIGLAKALALRTDLPQLAIPTTYAGSEMTDILGQTASGQKQTVRSPKVLPETVLYDVDLTLTLPHALTVTSGVNAIAHAVETLYAPDVNPLLALMAEEGIAALARGIAAIVDGGETRVGGDAVGRRDALYGAWLCGACLGSATMGLHHKLCHTLGGMFNLPHAETHTVLLPHALAYNAPSAAAAAARVARALGVGEAAGGLHDLIARWNGPRSLAALGMPESGIDAAADAAVRNPYANPRPVERDAVRALIARAWSGAVPLP